jgi:hypothetical protein
MIPEMFHCGTIQIFGNGSEKSKFDSPENENQIEFR